MEAELNDRQPSRPWLMAAGLALALVCLVPPLSLLARRYLFVESVQFCVFAMAAPVLAVLGMPRRLFPPSPDPLARPLAEAGRRPLAFVVALGYLIAWVLVSLFWRLPPVLDELARYPVLALAEAVTLCAAGLGLWLELVQLPSRAPRLGRPQRACVAALGMWSIWVIAYVLGFARGSVVHGYDGGGSHLLTVDDQEITAFLLWAAAAVSFLPVVFTAMITWLTDGSEPAGEPARGAPGTAVKGWGPRARERRRTWAP